VSEETPKRPWLAVLLALVYPGLGHAYLRAWLRALLWVWMAVLAVVLFVPDGTFDGVASVSALPSIVAGLPTEALVALGMVAAFNVVDAYWQATQTITQPGMSRCPHCGKEIDDDLEIDFCHWCTSPIDTESAAQ